MFSKVHLVRKINATDDREVNRIFTLLEAICRNGTNSVPIVQERDIDSNTLVIAIGGDGTMLEAMRLAHFYGAIVTGINLGRIGFLTDFVDDQGQMLDDLYDAIHEDQNPIEQRIALTYRLVDKSGSLDFVPRHAFNEFVISNKFSDQLIKYKLFIGDRCAGVHRANALIIGTPTGSTAYTLSAGGGLLLPFMEAMQIVPVAPISMTSRPIIIPSHEEVRISVETEGEWIFKSDGKNISTFSNDLSIDTQIEIFQSKNKVNILHSKYWSYFDMLTQKLGWKSN